MLNKSAEAIPYPCCVVHEIVDRAVRVGSGVEGGIKVGDRVGVGTQVTLAGVLCKAIATNPRQGINISAPSTSAYLEASN